MMPIVISRSISAMRSSRVIGSFVTRFMNSLITTLLRDRAKGRTLAMRPALPSTLRLHVLL
jgi:hypothetical protein